EPGPLLGLIDRLEAAPQELDTAGYERCREVERRLAAVRHDGRQESLAWSRLDVDHAPDTLRIERLEVQPGARIEVGRDRLGVRVDHHRLPAGATEGFGRLNGAVVELDPLPDPDRAAADHE